MSYTEKPKLQPITRPAAPDALEVLPDGFVCINEAALALGRSWNAVYDAIAAKRIEAVKVANTNSRYGFTWAVNPQTYWEKGIAQKQASNDGIQSIDRKLDELSAKIDQVLALWQ